MSHVVYYIYVCTGSSFRELSCSHTSHMLWFENSRSSENRMSHVLYYVYVCTGSSFRELSCYHISHMLWFENRRSSEYRMSYVFLKMRHIILMDESCLPNAWVVSCIMSMCAYYVYVCTGSGSREQTPRIQRCIGPLFPRSIWHMGSSNTQSSKRCNISLCSVYYLIPCAM